MTKQKQILNDSKADQSNGAIATTQDVLTHHLSCVGDGDLFGLMADYSPDARFFTRDGVLHGSSAIRTFFAKLFEEFAKPGMYFEMCSVKAHPSSLMHRSQASRDRLDSAFTRRQRQPSATLSEPGSSSSRGVGFG